VDSQPDRGRGTGIHSANDSLPAEAFIVKRVSLAPVITLAALFSTISLARAQTSRDDLSKRVDDLYPSLEKLYLDLHQHPELSLHEQKTAAKMAAELRSAGFEVTEGVGGTGVVGVLRSGPGPTVLLRTELDALPVPEKTGLPYASHATAKNDAGEEVPLMHACGHDVHMTCWVGTARVLSHLKDQWHGTLVFIAQPAEERLIGARAMLADGLFTRFPKPDFCIALHDAPGLPAGKVGYSIGPALSSADAVDVTIYGKGGHGAWPQTTVDPIVIAARTILAWQTLVSRENNPQDFAILTVGSIRGGTKHNIIPDEVKMQLTVRAFRDDVRRRILAGISRIAKAEAAASSAPREPDVKVSESCAVTVNDPKLAERVGAALRNSLGDANVEILPPEPASEDFSEFGLAGVPSLMFRLGATNPKRFEEAQKSGETLPSLHSSLFAPDAEPAIKTGVQAEVATLLDLLAGR
jgi:hippurate hydrolase